MTLPVVVEEHYFSLILRVVIRGRAYHYTAVIRHYSDTLVITPKLLCELFEIDNDDDWLKAKMAQIDCASWGKALNELKKKLARFPTAKNFFFFATYRPAWRELEVATSSPAEWQRVA